MINLLLKSVFLGIGSCDCMMKVGDAHRFPDTLLYLKCFARNKNGALLNRTINITSYGIPTFPSAKRIPTSNKIMVPNKDITNQHKRRLTIDSFNSIVAKWITCFHSI